MSTARFSCGLLVVSALALACSVGCSKHDGPEVLRVQGTVTRDQQPVPGLFLNFIPQSGRPSWGVTDASGKYTLEYDRQRKGALKGPHRVFVAYKPRDPGEEVRLKKGNAKLPETIRTVVAKYGDAKTSPLSYDVQTDGQVIDIQLD